MKKKGGETKNLFASAFISLIPTPVHANLVEMSLREGKFVFASFSFVDVVLVHAWFIDIISFWFISAMNGLIYFPKPFISIVVPSETFGIEKLGIMDRREK